MDGPNRRDARFKVADKRAAPEEARNKAKLLLAQVALGDDPSSQKKQDRKALLVRELCDKYLVAARAGLVATRFKKPKRASTVKIDEGRVSRHILPTIGDKVANKLCQADVQRMIDAISAGETAVVEKTKARGVARVKGGAGAAARVVELLGGIWSWARKRGLVSGLSPTSGVDKSRGDAKDRILTPEELVRLGAVIREHEARKPMATAALRLIALTGLRRDEACRLRWAEIDTANSCLHLLSTKTGRSRRPIGSAALEILASLPRLNKDFLFPSRSGESPADLKKQLAFLFNAAGLPDARSHDLRRTFATTAEEEGYSTATVRELIGHSRRGVTERHYIRRPDAALIAAADRVSSRIATALDVSV